MLEIKAKQFTGAVQPRSIAGPKRLIFKALILRSRGSGLAVKSESTKRSVYMKTQHLGGLETPVEEMKRRVTMFWMGSHTVFSASVRAK